MSLSGVQLLRLIDAGLTTDQLRAVAEVMSEAATGRTVNAERQARYRERQRNESVTRNVTEVTPPPSSNGFSSDSSSLTTSSQILGGGGEGERDVLGWPVVLNDWTDRLIAETECADPVRDIWPRQSATVLVGWHETDRFEWRDVVAGIRSVMVRRATSPPKSWRYFSDAIARAKSDRTTKTVEKQANERYSPTYKTAAERNQDSTISAFRSVFGGSADGQGEPVNAA